TLAEYYQAAGDTQKSLDLQKRIVEERPDDADLRFRYAQTLSNRGKYAEACDQYKIVLAKQPRLMGNRYWEVIQAFRQAKRSTELGKVLLEADLKSIGQPYIFANLIQQMMETPEERTVALALLSKAWDTMPNYRSSLMGSLYNRELWKLPQVYELGRKS